MIERINLLLKAKNVSARQFAEEIGIQPSGMSHILSGRNNPSLDFVMKVVKRWPEVNINWLMFGKGEMYAGVPLSVPEPVQHPTEPQPSGQTAEQYDLFTHQGQPAAPAVSEPTSAPASQPLARPEVAPVGATLPKVEPQSPTPVAPPPSQPTVPVREVADAPITQPAENSVEATQSTSVAVQPTQKKKKVVKMIVMYDDHSFTEYFPE